MKKQILLTMVSGFAVFLAACGTESQASAENEGKELETIRFVDTGAEGMEELSREFGPFKDELEKATERTVEFFSISNRTAAATAMEFGQVDIVLTGPGEYVSMKNMTDVKGVVGITRPGYRSVIAVPASSDIQSIEDLRGKKIAMKDVGSTSGHIAPVGLLMEAGLDPQDDVDTLMLGETFVEAFKMGETDAVAFSLSRYNDLVEEWGEENIRVLAESEDLPNDLFVASHELSDEVVEELRQTMIDNQDELLESMLITGEHDHYEESEFVLVDDNDYDDLRLIYEELGIELD
ncbi:phosphate/phosphite/phosphonate ABC transporter substrate-binding protein [Alkalicoccobacillus murimartini]|uniref:Phosphonate transport system substrate-binding protein n=1 Tax=Alkalicoccobacillus murimartini TaxID=171685 RepID=A0ABT9YHQ2_9BACI|nr:phosphate/phosphite/phosphonate ABC transporter substrate-binding protein [Alkalicoccobacillus murimartini]MDQ0207362.1 phosphonate transport system substrate-binding protein [Alkalicoccobacillus murimartini]